MLFGKEINTTLAIFIENGQGKGVVRQDIIPMLTVYIFWSSITSFLTLAQMKGQFISKQFSISEELESKNGSGNAIHFVDILMQHSELQTLTNADGATLRDQFMAENVQWILQQEQRNGHEKIFVTGHNSHVAKWGSSDSMGKLLSKDAANGYYVIGTDFYKTHCNMPTRSPEKRTIQVFYSHDPLAKAAKLAGFDICWLDFTKVPENSELGRQASEYTYMGTLGESYSIIMRLLPPSYRMFQPPAVLYDSMIFVTDANPTKILEE